MSFTAPIFNSNEHDRFNAYVWALRSEVVGKLGFFPRFTSAAAVDYTKEHNGARILDTVWKEIGRHELLFQDKEGLDSTVFATSSVEGRQALWCISMVANPSGEGRIRVQGAGGSMGVLAIVASIQKSLEEIVANENEEEIHIPVYWMTPHGPHHATTVVTCPRWETIGGNYTAKTGVGISSTIKKIEAKDGGGKLIIWHGAPGTGKTWAIRSLIRALKYSHRPVVVTDADRFLEDSSYYYGVISHSEKPCLFILEDAAEGILRENRHTHGNRIAKLLNLTDGLVSQGRHDLFLITFNEDINEVDPAAIRPGRCLGVTEFGKFDIEGATQWLREHGFSGEFPNGERSHYTLAELYGILWGQKPQNHKLKAVSVGFRIGPPDA